MTTQEVKRKLAAILSADVKGYHRLIAKDEAGTLQTLNIYKELMTKVIRDHHGRVVDASGDNVLAEFASTVDAVKCGAEIQRELRTRNEKLPVHRKMEFRIGINLGDVIEEEDKIFGDGVNIAARMQNLTDGGGLCISGTVYEHIKSKLTLRYEYLGKQKVKNIIGPVKAYRVMIEPETLGSAVSRWKRAGVNYWKRIHPAFKILVALVAAGNALWQIYPRFISRPAEITPKNNIIEVASKDKMAFPLPDKPSIAVLPFVNMSGDKEQEYFSDGLTEEIINALAKLPQVFVIARNSSFTYKGKAVDVKQVGRELGVQYVMEGSVRKEADRIRISAQLVDTITGRHVFSERYDRELKEVFATQDEIAIKVLNSLRVVLTDGEMARFQARGVGNVEAYLKLLEAADLLQRVNKESNDLARRLAEEALALEPNSAKAHYILATTYFWEYWLGPPKSAEGSVAQGIEMAKKAIALDNSDPSPRAILGLLYVNKEEYDKAVEEAEQAVALAPNSSIALLSYGSTLMHSSRPKEAIPVFEKILRLSPVKVPSMCLTNLASSYRRVGQYEQAVRYYKRLLQDQPDHFVGNIGLTETYSAMGRMDEARVQAAEVLRINPKFSVERWAKTARFKNHADAERSVDALRKAGLK
ncbi:MAG TPA: tetratricopeptide repeat protein [Thermodesulfobacteriota bacterium]|nr:tetratricopeptide repeat protein [Thermodesulfobacteriota bacterium]